MNQARRPNQPPILAASLRLAEGNRTPIVYRTAPSLARAGRLELAESALHAPAATFGGVEFYLDLARKAAVLASRLINNHPLPDGNKRVGYLCALEFAAATAEAGPTRPTTPTAMAPSP